MDPQFIQNLRYKLQKRVRRLNSVGFAVFPSTLNQFWRFYDSNPAFSGIADQLRAEFPDIDDTVNKIFGGARLLGETDAEAAAIGCAVLRRLSNSDIGNFYQVARPFGRASKHDEAVETVREVFLEPFYEYVDEHLDDRRAMLALLLRNKHRSEWFHRDHLWNLIEYDPAKAEKSLALDMYAYLHDQGIDFAIEPSSISGEIDLIAAQGTTDPLLADTKIFDAASRGKAYIRKAFNQIYTYTQQYNEAFGYLVIFKSTDKDLRFSLSTPSPNIPVIVYNHKTIFLITIDIFPHPKPVSQRAPLSSVEITEEELIQAAAEIRSDANSISTGNSVPEG